MNSQSPARPVSRELILYGTLGCHLCELAEAVLLPCVAQGWQVELVDIAEDDALFERFSTRIPVLLHPVSGGELAWPFDDFALLRFLEQT